MAANKRPPQGGGTSANNGSGGTRQRILRIGVLLGGKIVEERLIRERMPVSVGQSMKNTFSVPAEGLPLEFTMFAIDDGKYYLRFLPKMDGRLSDGDAQVNTLDALKQKGATQADGYFQVPLGDAARGKVSLGDLTILFQLVAEPPRQPKPMLPASVRGSFADRIDPRLAVIVGGSIVLHFAVTLFFWLRDVEDDNAADRAYKVLFKQDQYEVAIEEPLPELPPDTGSAAGSAAAPETPQKPDVKPAGKPDAGGKPDKNPGGRNENTSPGMSEADAMAMANMLSNDSTTGDAGGMNDRAPAADLGDQVAAVREGGKTVVVGGGSNRGSRGDGGSKVGTGGGSKIDGPTGPVSAGGGTGEEVAPKGRISVNDKVSFDESSLTAEAVLKKIQQAYMTGIKRCYTTYLKKEATARGKVKLSLTVNESGRTTDGDAAGFADEVDTCIGNLMKGWTFPKPTDKDGESTEASFAITLQLVPD
jgi:hypothetical protein